MKDGHQAISHDRILIRIKDYLQIATTVGALIWGGYRLLRSVDEVLRMKQQIEILQNEIAHLQGLVANINAAPRDTK